MSQITELAYHLGLDSRLGKSLAVARFNIFAPDKPVATEACVEILLAFLLRQFTYPHFQVFFDFHEGALSTTLGESWAVHQPRSGVLGLYQAGPKTSVCISNAAGFKAVRQAAHALIDGTVFFRVPKRENAPGKHAVVDSWVLRMIPDRSESAYVALLPLFHAVGILECESCFMSVMSRSNLLDRFCVSAERELAARPRK